MEFFTILFYLIIFTIIIYLIHNYFNGPFTPLDPKENLKNKKIIITGCTKGIGKETALSLLEKGAKVIFACRDKTRTNKLIDSIEDLKMRSNAFFIQLDVSDFSSINSFIKEYKLQFKKFDILINNAGINFDYFSKIGNYEATIVTNYIGPFYLTKNILEYAEDKARIINLSSGGHELCRLKDINDFLSDNFTKENYTFITTYTFSKLCNIIHAKNLAEFFSNKNIEVKICAVHPGLVRSELFSQYEKGYMKFFVKFLWPLLYIFSKSTLAGAQTSLHCSYMDYEDLISGGYYANCKLTKTAKILNDEEICMKIIKKTNEIVEEIAKNIKEN